jgi:hypothetical protein
MKSSSLTAVFSTALVIAAFLAAQNVANAAAPSAQTKMQYRVEVKGKLNEPWAHHAFYVDRVQADRVRELLLVSKRFCEVRVEMVPVCPSQNIQVCPDYCMPLCYSGCFMPCLPYCFPVHCYQPPLHYGPVRPIYEGHGPVIRPIYEGHGPVIRPLAESHLPIRTTMPVHVAKK